MKAADAILVWTPADSDSPHAGEIRIERRGTQWSRSAGDRWVPAAELSDLEKGNSAKQKLAVFVNFNTVVVRDGVVPERAHEAFLNIDEYATTISRDTKGARDEN